MVKKFGRIAWAMRVQSAWFASGGVLPLALGCLSNLCKDWMGEQP
jgi:hypothetical protein